jgi:integrase
MHWTRANTLGMTSDTVAFPASISKELIEHLRWFSGPAGRVFLGPRSGLLRRSNFRSRWVAALRKSGVPAVHFHDLRHTGNTLAADTGASTRELMHRMGHLTTDAALRHQHMRGERDRLIADSIDEAIKKATGGEAQAEASPEGAAGPVGHGWGTGLIRPRT